MSVLVLEFLNRAMLLRFAFSFFLLAAMPLAHAEDWPQWRGSQGNGISLEMGWRDTWQVGGPLIAWKAKVGLGFSSFVVAQGRAFTMGHADGQDTIWCFDETSGKVLWKHSY